MLRAAVVDLILFMSDQILLAIAMAFNGLAKLVGDFLGNDAAIVDYSLFH
jgi:hypothetical protein